MIHTAHKDKARWWGNLGGDHDYSGKLTRILPINWIPDFVATQNQKDKGYGRRLDFQGKEFKKRFPADRRVAVIGCVTNRYGTTEAKIRQGEIKYMRYGTAEKLEAEGKVKITYYMDSIEKPLPRNIYALA